MEGKPEGVGRRVLHWDRQRQAENPRFRQAGLPWRRKGIDRVWEGQEQRNKNSWFPLIYTVLHSLPVTRRDNLRTRVLSKKNCCPRPHLFVWQQEMGPRAASRLDPWLLCDGNISSVLGET